MCRGAWTRSCWADAWWLGQVTRKKPREELSSEAGAAAARLSKRLVVIRTDIDLPPLRCAYQPAEIMRVQALMLLSG